MADALHGEAGASTVASPLKRLLGQKRSRCRRSSVITSTCRRATRAFVRIVLKSPEGQERLRHSRHRHQAARLGSRRRTISSWRWQRTRRAEAIRAVPQRAILLDRDWRRSRQRRGSDQRRGNDRSRARAVLDRAVSVRDGKLVTWNDVKTSVAANPEALPLPQVTWSTKDLDLNITPFAAGAVRFVCALRALPRHQHVEAGQETDARISRSGRFR